MPPAAARCAPWARCARRFFFLLQHRKIAVFWTLHSYGSYIPVPVEITINGQLADLTNSNKPFEYYGPEVLRVKWIYPVAGPKKGGTTVTIYGTGFKSLGLDILPSFIDRSAMSTTGYMGAGRAIKCIFGDLVMVEGRVLFPIGDERARAALGDDRVRHDSNGPWTAHLPHARLALL